MVYWLYICKKAAAPRILRGVTTLDGLAGLLPALLSPVLLGATKKAKGVMYLKRVHYALGLNQHVGNKCAIKTLETSVALPKKRNYIQL